jgi:hypothetical protein
MKAKAMITILAVAAMVLAAPLAALGAQGSPGRPDDPGPGNGGPGTGGSAGDAAGALYGDLYVIERDGNGVPLTRDVTYTYTDSETGETVTDTATCNQPLNVNCALLPFWGECGLDPLPDGVLTLPECTFDPELYDPCAVYATEADTSFADQLQAVSFGRESVVRSPESVVDSSYAEALKSMNEATNMKKDPAGRIMLYLPVEDDPTSFFWKTIDAPLENLGMYKAVMTDNCLSPGTEIIIGDEGSTSTEPVVLTASAVALLSDAGLDHLVCDTGTEAEKADYLSAAVFIGAAADKTSPITLDEIININTYLRINEWVYVSEKKETTLTITWLDFGDFNYKKGVDACISPTYATLLTATSATTFEIPDTQVNVFGVSPPGVDLRGANGVPITVCRAGLPYAETCELGEGNTPYDPVEAIGCGGANWFAQAAEDARKTIWYLHNWRVPEVAY